MFVASTHTCGVSSIIEGTTPASISTVKTTRLRAAASFGLHPTNLVRSSIGSSTSTHCSLYALTSIDFVFLRDFECFFFPSHGYLKRTQHPAREYVILFAGKGFYLTYMIILPVVLLGKSPLLVGLAFLLTHMIIGLTVALVFQTTHTVDSTYFPSNRAEFDNGVYHIFATTADYATTSPLVAWLVGGLNHHIAHHLCPFVCHTHYASLTRIVKETAQEFGVPYRQHPTMRGAIRHHLILLKQLGTENSFSNR